MSAAYTLTRTVGLPYEAAVERVRDALSEQGFGILTEIDIAATLKKKLDVDVDPQIILGACRPQLAHQALQAEASVAALLPCNVVVRGIDASSSVVEAVDPQTMVTLTGNGDLASVADDAGTRLGDALDALPPAREDTP